MKRKLLIAFCLNVAGVVCSLPWLFRHALTTLPEAILALLTPPPENRMIISPEMFDYTASVLLSLSVEIAPVLGIVWASIILCAPKNFRNLQATNQASAVLVFKSALPIAGLLVMRLITGDDFLLRMFSIPDYILVLAISPALGGLGWILSRESSQDAAS